jgi:hypothetical protein
MRTLNACFVILLGSLACALIGCNKGPTTYKVSGKVSFKGGPMPHAGVRSVQFIPQGGAAGEPRGGAGGTINDDGTFEMHGRKPTDGVYPGEYSVTFAVWPGPMEPKSLLLPKYSDPNQTPYKNIKVDRNIDDLNFEVELIPGVAGAPAAKTGT